MGNELCCKSENPESEKRMIINDQEKIDNLDFYKNSSSSNKLFKSRSPLNDSTQRTYHTPINLSYYKNEEDSIQKIQQSFRSFRNKKKFDEKIKPGLIKYQNDYLSFLNDQCLPEPEDNFDYFGYRKFYGNNDPFFSYNYGHLIEDKVQIIHPDDMQRLEIYKGAVNSNGQKHGKGFLTTPQFTRQGTWREGAFTGWGRETRRNGDVFEGKFITGYLNGKGIFRNSKNHEYIGDFVNNKKEGQGELITDKVHYKGDFKNDKIQGYGSITFLKEGHKYEGQFDNNELNGKGIFYWKNGDVYEGDVRNGKMNGIGKYTYANGEVYVGSYIDGVKQGSGTALSKSGMTYKGNFIGGSLNGEVLLSQNRESTRAEFRNDKLVKQL